MTIDHNFLSVITYLENIVAKRETLPENNILPSFTAKVLPTISIKNYTKRLASKMDCSLSCFMLAISYIERLSTKMVINNQNVHRILLASVVVACKVVEDECDSNIKYALIGGISPAELFILEIEFLSAMEFDVSRDRLIFDSLKPEM